MNSTIHSTTNEIPMERLSKEGLKNYDAVPPYHSIRNESRRYREIPMSLIWVTAIQFLIDLQKGTARCRYLVKPLRTHWQRYICTHEIRKGHCEISRIKEHFQGLLSEILKQKSIPKARCSPSFKFIKPEV